VRRALAAAAVAAVLGVASWQAALALQEETPVPETEAAPSETAAPEPASAKSATPPAAPAAPLVHVETPMAERIAVLGVLNKRNGLSRDVTLKPGQAVRIGDLVVRLRACEATADWEPEKLTGAFVQADVRGRDARWRRIFSGWLYKESPSLNVVAHPIYDVWPKSCAMRHPDIGPETVSVTASAPARSRAKKSAAPESEAQPEPGPTPKAPSSNAT